jgi:DNA topoisomerase II
MPKATDYGKMTPREHVLARSDTYIGSIDIHSGPIDVYDPSTGIESKDIKYVPGLYKIFDEVLVNASDASVNDPSCDTIRVEYNKEEKFIKIYNNGQQGIPVEEHPIHKTLVPSMIFGEMLTSSNYDDTTKRTTGGRNGYGAKLANIFSKRFEVEVGDSKNEKKFHQVWKDNMLIAEKPSIKKYSKKGSYVQITFYPDLEKFGLTTMDDDHYNLFYKRVVDIAGISNDKHKIFFNDVQIKVTNFKQYIQLYYPDKDILYDDSNERWKVGCIYMPESNMKTVSFVNAISTYNGGTHVNHVTAKIISRLIDEFIKKKEKDIKITPNVIKDNMVFFINSVIENPAFSSQTKGELTTKVNKFGSSYESSDIFVKKIAKSGIVEQMIQLAKFKEISLLKKNDGKKQITLHGIPKLDDANKAGGKEASKCSLILTEGDSAKTFAMSGLSIIGRDYYGVFPLKGKMLNVREAPCKQYMTNEEINNLKKIMGLKQELSYENEEDFKTLRYGRIICLTDQDVDGSHIKGLLMNLFHFIWPALVKRHGFITSFATPIVKSFKGKESHIFYNLTEYKNWVESINMSGWKIKYYKGLGTSTAAEAKEYFIGMEEKLIKYYWTNMLEETKGCEDAITLAFMKSRANDRKEWLYQYDKNEILGNDERDVSYKDFINKDLKHFSNYDNSRSIPNIMDGLKTSHRKIIFGANLRGLDKDEVKVAQLAGFVSDKAAYHHGEMSLVGAIVGLAQDYIGSNNINLLKPIGMFGSRLMGGKDAAAGRYIFTMLTDVGMKIFNKADDNILNRIFEEGTPIEPEYYAPIIPMILVNGTEGIGTGFSTFIPPFNPTDIIANLYNIMNGKKFKEMKPYWKGFTGIVRKLDKKSFEVTGLYSIKNNKLIINELPIGTWTQSYKEFLEKLYETDSNKNKEDRVFIGFKEFHTDTTVHFELEFIPNYIETVVNIVKDFHLSSKVSLTNMTLYSVNGSIKKYDSPQHIMLEYYETRLELYEQRKQHLLNCMKNTLDIISNKVKFILMVVENKLSINNRKKSEIVLDLIKHKFPQLSNNENISFDYLLTMPIYQLTFEKIEALKKQMNEKQIQYDGLFATNSLDIWKGELEELEKML